MVKKDEITEIREMLDNFTRLVNKQNNYAKTVNDEELKEGVTYLSKKDTGLSEDIIVDCGETYKIYNHKLCLYIVKNNEVYPVLISDNPISPTGAALPLDIERFIRDEVEVLVKFANMEIDGGDFFDAIKNWKLKTKSSYGLVVEMSNYGPDKTGLPVWVYVDDTGSYLRSGHNGSYRIKFQQDKSIKNPRLWMPITIPGLEVLEKSKVPPCKEPSKNVEMVIKWAKYNLPSLIKLRDGEITGAEFKEQMITMDEIAVLMDSESKKNNKKENK